MSIQNENEQDLAYSNPENGGTNANNDPQRKKQMTAFVQIGLDGSANGQEVKLSQNRSTVAKYGAYLQEKINKSHGNLIGLQLNDPVQLVSIFEKNVALMDHNVPLEADCKYTFRFKLANVQEEKEKNVPDPIEELAKQMAKLTEEQAKQQGRVEQLEKWKEEQKNELEKHQKQLEEAEMKLEGQQRIASAEYARLIGVPNVANLQEYYDKEKLLQLVEHGNIPSIYIQMNQLLNDEGILQNIVDLLATAEMPAKMVGQVTIEFGLDFFTWPKHEELKLKEKKPSVALTWNEASKNPQTNSTFPLAEYELTNQCCHFQVLVHYYDESYFDKAVLKFIYSRLQ